MSNKFDAPARFAAPLVRGNRIVRRPRMTINRFRFHVCGIDWRPRAKASKAPREWLRANVLEMFMKLGTGRSKGRVVDKFQYKLAV